MGRIRLYARPVAGLVVAGVIALGASACGSSSRNDDLVAGKQMFVKNCGACHALNRAETKGVTGPNLDDAFRASISDGLGRSTIKGAVRRQIEHPGRFPEDSPVYMPANLVEGRDAENVAAYVAAVASRTGKDTGLLATAVKKAGSGKPVAEQDGKLEIDADPSGQLAYVAEAATASAGPIEIDSKNESQVGHNIAIEGNGVDEKGEVVQGGGVSKVSAELDPGEYTFYCSVPGHREGGMVGKLVVK
jgi:mono/diheme cytochrome c family protein